MAATLSSCSTALLAAKNVGLQQSCAYCIEIFTMLLQEVLELH